jgi:DNA-directed RNA polymerase subunit beta'
VSNLKKREISELKVRSPLKCLAPKGTCAHCYGLDEHKAVPEVGENVGAKAGQTISEPLVQISMNSFHTGGAAGTGAQAGGFQRINQLLSLPKTLAGAATLAPTSGKITKVIKGIAGGYDVFIGDHKAHVPQGRKPIISVGDDVSKGDSLSEGPIKPQELTELKGVTHAQDYITNQLQETYKQQGVGINRKTFETVVRSLTNTTQVTRAPEGSHWIPGDVIPLNVANHYNETLLQPTDVHDAIGLKLAEGVGSLQAGHTLTEGEAKALESNGVHQVKVLKGELTHKPFVKGLQTLPLLKQDWMAALGYRNLAKALTEGASQGWQTDIEGYHPLPALAHGSTFGKGKEGRY